ncbi:MAG: hypothetical protein JST92_14430 [Deltaproteobacteria bacterium]|nr:hypothetical protein [Deltaproteobacteria bacterium]
MPLLTFNVAAKTFDEIAKLIEAGAYSGMNQFLEVAALNQLALERGTSPEELRATSFREAPARSEHRPDVRGSEVVRSTAIGPARREIVPIPKGAGRGPVGRRKTSSSAVPEEEVSALKRNLALITTPSPRPEPLPLRPRSENEQIWGQVNRLLAMKLVVRWLDTTTTGHSAWPKVDACAPGITSDAAALGSLLDTDDLAKGRKREELFATGLPRRGNIPSVDRFQTQYIARLTRSGEIYPGAVCHYGLADFDGDQLGLTARGVEFARLPNPIADGSWETATKTLSSEERAFLIRHVRDAIPGERLNFETVLAAVAAGSDTPEELLTTVQGVLPDTWSDVMARTHVSGVVARMSELGLLQRTWEGRHVRYSLTASASPFLNPSGELPPEVHHVN